VQIEPGRFEVVAATRPVTDLKGIVRPAEQGRFDRRYEQGDCGPRGIGSMIGLDTNVLVRYIMQDDADQSAKANKLIESLSSDKPGFIPLIAIVELVWVLESCFQLTRDQLVQALDALLHTKERVVDRADRVMKALRVFKAGTADFADCLIERGASSAGCSRTLTFAVAAAKTAGMTLIP
jgi:predicted nucleic-acid-binding protein